MGAPRKSRKERLDESARLQALRESEARYRELVDNSNDTLYTHDLAGHFTSVNRAGELLLGHSREELLRMTIDQVVAPESLPLAREMIARKIADEEPTRYEVEVLTRDGRRVRLEVSTRLVVRDGRPVGVQGIARDITERTRAEEALREREARLRLVVEQMPGVLWATDRELRFTSAVGSTLADVGLRPARMLGASAVDFFGADENGRRAVAAHRQALDGQSARCELIYRGRAFQVHGEPLRNLAGDITGTIGVALDISERKRAEQALRDSEAQFRAVFESAPVGIARADGEGRLVAANPFFLTLTGYVGDDWRSRRFTDHLHPDDVAAAWRDFGDLVSGQRDRYQADRRFRQPDGNTLWVTVTTSVVRDEAGVAQFYITVVEDISERKRAEQTMRENNQRLAGWVSELEQRTREVSLLGELSDLLQVCRSREEAYEVIGGMGVRLFPVEAGAVCIQTGPQRLEAVAAWGAPEEETVFAPDDCWALRRGRPHVVEGPRFAPLCPHLAGVARRAHLCVPMMAQGKALGILHLAMVSGAAPSEARQRFATMVAEHVALALGNLELSETLRHHSVRDPLTGLFNRRYMEESLERECARADRRKHELAVVMLDLDGLKPFNDTHGHDAGDALLRAVGALLARHIRGSDIACRYGGEEFTVILPDITADAAVARAESLRGAVKEAVVHHLHRTLGPVTASFGVALYPEHATTAETLLRVADAALYRAKANGRDRIELASA